MSQNRLGRGLSTLIPQKTSRIPTPEPVADPSPNAGIATIPISKIRPTPMQPRTTIDQDALEELAASIKSKGILQPILIRPARDVNGEFDVVAGERRYRAALLAGLDRIPAVIRDIDDREAAELALIENVQRVDLQPIERAIAYRNYIRNFQVSPDELALRLGESRASISNYMRLLNLPEEILQMIDHGELGMGHARALLGVTSTERRFAIARLAVRRNLSVREVEELASRAEREAAEEALGLVAERAAAQRHVSEVERMLSRALGLRVTLQTARKKNAGRVVIHYNSLEEYDRIAARLGAPTMEH